MDSTVKYGLVAALLLAGACTEDTRPPTTPELDAEEQITLLAPSDGLVVPQNDPTIGCPPHPYRGYGFELSMDWADVEGATGTTAYHLRVQNRTAQFAMIDQIVEASEYTMTACNGFVIDRNLEGWEWRVRVQAADGSTGPWSVREFSFAPCRLESGRACYAPGP